MKKIFIIIILAALVWSCNKNGDLSDAFGSFEANPIIVSSEATGKVLNLNIKQGEKINQGKLVAIIDTTQVILKKQQLEAQVEAVKARRCNVSSQIAVFEEQIKNLKINEDRITKMLADGAATQKQLDDITGQINVVEKQVESTRTQFTSINSEIEVLKTQLIAVDDQLNRCSVINPTDGNILETFIEEGEITVAGKALYKLANTDELTLKVYVSGAMLPSVKVGQEVSVLIDKDEETNQEMSGTVTWISPEAEFTPKIIQTKEERVKLVYAVKVIVKNDGRLKIGMPGEVKF
ncbi:MAG: HlyD family efflux transporter periplasmic adaptor subunit [Prolixibacteraceae bacterium]|nr:HlyD family efflux transporter periplasmic adaptor subunit [Prolixibacteraceae bacterium]MBN2775629.1 HlyD family efflux transporter periplasmic adaptor subunit [Prolixibacteraceae bacterium]